MYSSSSSRAPQKQHGIAGDDNIKVELTRVSPHHNRLLVKITTDCCCPLWCTETQAGDFDYWYDIFLLEGAHFRPHLIPRRAGKRQLTREERLAISRCSSWLCRNVLQITKSLKIYGLINFLIASICRGQYKLSPFKNNYEEASNTTSKRTREVLTDGKREVDVSGTGCRGCGNEGGFEYACTTNDRDRHLRRRYDLRTTEQAGIVYNWIFLWMMIDDESQILPTSSTAVPAGIYIYLAFNLLAAGLSILPRSVLENCSSANTTIHMYF